MGAIKDLWNSERGLLGLVLILAVTVLCAVGRISETQWLDYTWKIFLAYASSKTVTGAVDVATKNLAGKDGDPPASSSTTPTPAGAAS